MVNTLGKKRERITFVDRQEKKRHFKAVRMRKWGKWVSEVRVPNSSARIWLGSFDFPHQAARAYDCAVYCLRGSNANFNFPNSLPEISSASSLSPAQIRAIAAKFAVQEFRQVADYSAVSLSWTDSEQRDLDSLDSLLGDIESSFVDEVTENTNFPIIEEERSFFSQETKNQ